MSRFAWTTVASSLHDAGSVDRITADPAAVLTDLGGVRGDHAPVLLVATGGTEREIVDRWSRGDEHPVLLVAHPGHNSLPAALEALARIHQLEGRGRISYLEGGEDRQGQDRLEAGLTDLGVWESLHRVRIGAIGEPSEWLVASSPDATTVRSVWGPEVVGIPIERLIESWAPAPGADAEAAKAAGVTAALDEIVAEEDLDAVTVRCFDLIDDLDTTGCVALSALNDRGVIAGCEGDLVSAIGMLWGGAMTGTLPWMANPARIDEAGETITLAHCTVPRSIVETVRLDTHFESGRGIGIAGEFAPGPVTLVRIGGASLDRLWLAEGEIVAAGDDATLCRTQIDVAVSPGVAGELLRSPLGNHLVVIAGHHAGRMAGYHEWLIA